MPSPWADASATMRRWYQYHYGDEAERELEKLYPDEVAPAPPQNLIAPPDTPPPPPPPPPIPEKPTTPHYAAELAGKVGPYVTPQAAAPPAAGSVARPLSTPTPGGSVPPTLPAAFQVSRSTGPRADAPNAERQPLTSFGISGARGLGVNPGRPVPAREAVQAQQLFNPDDPEGAVYNVLRDMGVDAYKTQSPVAAELLQNAKGLTDAYYIDLALSGQPHSAERYASYLRGLLGGGSVPKTQLRRAAERLPALVPQIRDYMARMELGGPATAELPLQNTGLTTLATMLGDPSGGALASLLTRLMNPSIPTSAGRTAYARQLMAATAAAQRAQADRGYADQLGSLNDFWTYLLGAGPAPSYV